MLNYNIQYDVAVGILMTFKNNQSKRSLSVNHSEAKRDKLSLIFPYAKFHSFTKENFIVTCLYIMYKINPSSINKLIECLREIDFQSTVLPFKNSITQYKANVVKDVMYIREHYGNPSFKTMLKEYKKANIKFYTLYFYMKKHDMDIKALIESEGHLVAYHLKQIKQLMLYITFKQTAIDTILNAFDNETELFRTNKGE